MHVQEAPSGCIAGKLLLTQHRPAVVRGKAVILKRGEIVVQRDDHYLPLLTISAPWFTFNPFGSFRDTYKQAYERRSGRIGELEAFLADLLILDPSLEDRFNKQAAYGDDDEQVAPKFEWDFEGAHAAADVLRSDAADAEKRAAIKKFQGKK